MGITFSDPDTDTDADIADIAALSPSDGDMLYWATGGTRYNTTSSQSYGRSLLNTSTSLALKALIKQPFVFLEDYGTTAADFSTAWAAVAAAGGGMLILPEATIAFGNTQVTLDGNRVTVCGMGSATSIISSTYTGGPAIVLGNTSTQTLEYAFEDVGFSGVAGQTFFKSGYVRGIYLRRCDWSCDRLFWLGDTAGGTGKPTYVFHMEDCASCAQVASPTLHHIYAENFSGQFVMSNVFVEGQYAAGIDGFYAGDNIQTRIDHFVVSGGYFSRFRDNYSFVDARVVNLHIGPDHESEGALRNSVRLEVTTSTSKTTAQVGWGNVLLAGKYASSGGNALYLKNERASTDSSNINIGPCVFTSEITYTPVLLESAVGSIVATNISNLTADFTPVDASQDMVKIIGGSSAATIEGVTVSNIAGRAITTALRSVVRVEGITAKIARPKNLSVKNATVAVSDARLAVLDEHEYIQEPEGRLTLTTATPVLSSSVTAATSIYYTPFKGNRIPLLTESLFCERTFSELTLALDSDSGHTGYHQSGKNFDLFIYNDAGTLRLCSGPAWSSDTGRAASLTMLRGLYVNGSTMTLKYDATSNTISAGGNTALYVGTFRASANGQTEMSLGAVAAAAGGTANKLYLWNAYNQAMVSATCRDNTDTWTYSTAAWQAKNASASNSVAYVTGLAQGNVRALASAISTNDNANIARYNGIGKDGSTAIASGCLTGFMYDAAGVIVQGVAHYNAPLSLGLSTLYEIEYSTATGTSTWRGDGGGASVIQTGMTVELMM